MPRLATLLRELAVPAVMLGCIALFVAGSRHLSLEAWIFPIGLILVALAALGAALWPVLRGRAEPAPQPAEEGEADDTAGPILALRPWLLVAVPGVLFTALSVLSMPVALVLAAAAVQRALGERSLLRNVIVPLVLVVPTYLAFNHILFVRFPPNLLGF